MINRDKILKDENEKIKRELEQVNELTDITAKEDEIHQRLAAIVAKDPGMQHLQQKLGELYWVSDTLEIWEPRIMRIRKLWKEIEHLSVVHAGLPRIL